MFVKWSGLFTLFKWASPFSISPSSGAMTTRYVRVNVATPLALAELGFHSINILQASRGNGCPQGSMMDDGQRRFRSLPLTTKNTYRSASNLQNDLAVLMNNYYDGLPTAANFSTKYTTMLT
ncbi:unnamed protein product [Sphenostylis stenocarpa]|uniref:Uncharacterized protein n=1 Tax=Sphenostylis stenocarpa TaxID=92480 RepID=A0AA86S4C8_9FABA|nr:unnamed protein product [Sphenostylis stenocarpa]